MTNRKIITSALIAVILLTGCGQIEEQTESRTDETTTVQTTTAAVGIDESIIENGTITTTTTTTKSETTTSETEETTAATTSIVVMTDKDGKPVSSFVIGPDGNIKRDPNAKTTTTTTTKTTTTTTARRQSENNSAQGNGNSNNGGWNNNNNNGGTNNGNSGNGGNDQQSYTPPETTTTTQAPPQTTTTTQAPQTTTTVAAQAPSGYDDLTPLEQAYLKCEDGYRLTDAEWELIRKDIVDYGINKFNGKTVVECYDDPTVYDFLNGSARTLTVTCPYPINWQVDESLKTFKHAHLNVGTGNNGDTEPELHLVDYLVQNDADGDYRRFAQAIQWYYRSMYDMAVQVVCYFYSDDIGFWDDFRINVGYMDDGWIWFLND